MKLVIYFFVLTSLLNIEELTSIKASCILYSLKVGHNRFISFDKGGEVRIMTTKNSDKGKEQACSNVQSPDREEKKEKPWTKREMEEAEPYPLPELPVEVIEKKKGTTTEKD